MEQKAAFDVSAVEYEAAFMKMCIAALLGRRDRREE